MLTVLRQIVGACLLCCETSVRSFRLWILPAPEEVPVLVAVPVPPVRAQATGTDPQVPEEVLDLRALRRRLIRTGPVARPRHLQPRFEFEGGAAE